MRFLTLSAEEGEARAKALAFYAACGRSVSFGAEDVLLVAAEEEEKEEDWLGIVRLAREEGVCVLRTMQVKPGYQGQNIGSQILKHFLTLLRSLEVEKCWCFAYAHLERFYGQIGFRKVNEAPDFLVARAREASRSHPEEAFILMRWN